jgi:hypothetical protein
VLCDAPGICSNCDTEVMQTVLDAVNGYATAMAPDDSMRFAASSIPARKYDVSSVCASSPPFGPFWQVHAEHGGWVFTG